MLSEIAPRRIPTTFRTAPQNSGQTSGRYRSRTVWCSPWRPIGRRMPDSIPQQPHRDQPTRRCRVRSPQLGIDRGDEGPASPVPSAARTGRTGRDDPGSSLPHTRCTRGRACAIAPRHGPGPEDAQTRLRRYFERGSDGIAALQPATWRRAADYQIFTRVRYRRNDQPRRPACGRG